MRSSTTLIFAAIAFAACGGGDDTSTASSSSTNASSASSGGAASTATSTSTSTTASSTSTGGSNPGTMPGVPVAFFTDLASAPAGAYVTVWGARFGASQGSSTITLGAAAVDVVSWSDGEIEFQLPAAATSGDLVITNAFGASPPLSLGVHSGKLWFLAPNGDDANDGSEAKPLETWNAAKEKLAAGDVLYLRAQTITAEDDYNAVLALHDLPQATAAAPIAIVAYPGETVTIGDGTLARGVSLYHGDATPNFSAITIAKLHFLPSCDGIELIYADDGRFVGNEISGAHDACENGVIETQGTSGWKIFGNHLHDNGNTKLEHGIYLGGYGTQSDYEIGWNRIENQSGGRAIQIYGHIDGDSIHGVSIHDNVIRDIDRDGVVIGESDGDVLTLDDVKIFDNVFVRAGRCDGHGVRVDNSTATNVIVAANTFVDDGAGDVACDQSPGQAGGQVTLEDGVEVTIVDNLFAAKGSEGGIDSPAVPPMLTVSNNLYDGASAPAFESAPTNGSPAFVDESNEDFHLTATSAAIGKGIDAGVAADHDGIARPSKPDLGAYQFIAK